MKVQLLGTSAAEGWPGLFCRCDACLKARRLRGKNVRTRSSALIGDALKIDLPPDTLHHIIESGLDMRRVHALLFTHGHDDHFAVSELQYMTAHFVPEPITTILPIYGPSDVIERLERRMPRNPIPVSLHTLRAWEPTTIADYRVTPIEAQHDRAITCFNYIIQAPDGATLLYATDTGWYHDATWSFIETLRLDGIVVECTKGPIEGGYMAHLCIPEVIRLRRRLISAGAFRPESPLVTTHFSHLGGLMHEELEAAFSGENIQVGFDGMTFAIPGHSEVAG